MLNSKIVTIVMIKYKSTMAIKDIINSLSTNLLEKLFYFSYIFLKVLLVSEGQIPQRVKLNCYSEIGNSIFSGSLDYVLLVYIDSTCHPTEILLMLSFKLFLQQKSFFSNMVYYDVICYQVYANKEYRNPLLKSLVDRDIQFYNGDRVGVIILLPMLQIDENEVQIYSCSFRLFLRAVQIPIKLEGQYFIQWKIKNGSSKVKSAFIDADNTNNANITLFNQTLKLHTQALKHIRTSSFLKKHSQITLYLRSSKNPQRPKIVGSMLLGLHQILNTNKYSELKRHRLSLSPFEVDLQFKCEKTQCSVSSIFQANLQAALHSEQNFLIHDLPSHNSARTEQEKISFRKKITKQYNNEDDELSKGDCSMIKLDFQDNLQVKSSQKQQRIDILAHSAAIISEPHFQRVLQVDEQLQNRVKAMQNKDLQWFVKENKNLKRLLWVSKNERKMQIDRFEQQLRELARQLSLKQAELLKLSDHQQSKTVKIGQLLDEANLNTRKIEGFKRQNESLLQQLNIQKQLNLQLLQNYQRLEERLSILKDWQIERNSMFQKITSQEQEHQMLKVKCLDLEHKLISIEQQSKQNVAKFKLKVQELEGEVFRRDHIILIYQEKVSKFQHQIELLQEQQQTIHKVQYTAFNELQIQQKCQRKADISTNSIAEKTPFINIVDEQENSHELKRINQEEQQYSEISSPGQKQVATAAQLPDHQSDFYRKMARNVQEQLDQLRVLYHDKQVVIFRERSISKNLHLELERLRFEFVYELSKVTAILNQKMFEIRELKEQNLRLKQRDTRSVQSIIFKLENDINSLHQQKLQFFDRCYRLQEENIALINLNREKQQIFQSILRSPDMQNLQQDLIVKQFERLISIMINNSQFYQTILKKYGLLEQTQIIPENNHEGGTTNVNILKPNNLSEIINNFCPDVNTPSDSESNSFSLKSQQQLLLQSTARVVQSHQTFQTQNYLASLVGQFSQLKVERQKGISFIKDLAIRNRQEQPNTKKTATQIQNLKKYVTSVCSQGVRKELLRLIKALEQSLSLTDFYGTC